MRTHTFALLLEQGPTDQELDQLADICPDAGFTDLEDGAARAEFDTSSSHDLLLAIANAIADTRLGGLVVTGVAPVTQVMNQHVADRVGRTQQELVEQVWRSEVIHPKPVVGPNGCMDWTEVRAWLRAHRVPCDYDWAIEAADRAYQEFSVPERHWLGQAEMDRRFWQTFVRLQRSPWDPDATHQLTVHYDEGADRWEGLCSAHRLVYRAADGTADGHDETLQALCDHDRADHGERGAVPTDMLLVPGATPAHRRAVTR